MNIKYIGFYRDEGSLENRISTLSAINKMDYIILKLNDIGYNVDIISPSWTNDKKFFKGKKINLNKYNTLVLPLTIPWRKFLKIISLVISQAWLFFYLIFNTTKNEKLIVYHSLWLIYPLYLAKKIKKFKLILELEEIYQDAKKVSKVSSWMEYKVIESADSYIFPTVLLNEIVNKDNKANVIVCGTYQLEEKRKKKIYDDKIHIVYAGTFDTIKGGVKSSIEMAPYLSEKYHLHIVGFGDSIQIKETKELIKKNSNLSKCKLTYEGELRGEEYIQFLQACDIGLSTQNPSGKFNETSFPSKVFSYIVNGLRVVSLRLKVLTLSPVNEIIYYSANDTSQALAETVMSIDINEYYDSRKLIKNLDEDFQRNLKKLVGECNEKKIFD